MSSKINLDVQTILDKEFNVDFKGYSPKEVDSFLDDVIQDYEQYEKMTEELNEKIAELERTNASLRAKLIEVEGKTKALEVSNSPVNEGAANVDILKRLSRLEEEVFNRSNNQ